ncbi:MAG TPA: SDR family oxidoreductase [Pseudolabrys sp.]|jgi:NAD(P)-dependent dehydrogenase (short-subunit alcohol dehydrogenase family)
MAGADKSRVVLLTGAAGGLGTVMTTALLEAGHAVVAADRNAAALEKLAAIAAPHRARFLSVQADVAEAMQCEAAVAKTIAHFGRIEGIINNAGIGPSSLRPDAEKRLPSIEELTPDIWDQFFAVNVRAALNLMRAALAPMRKQKWGRIVNNTTSFRTMLRVLPYGATKSALESMSAVWAAELAGTGITVNVLVPGGPTDTPFVGDGSGWKREQMLRPQIMAQPACWLMSEAADQFTGRRITAAEWDVALAANEAARRAGRSIGWPELADQTAWWPAG